MMNVIYTNVACDWDVEVDAKAYEWMPVKRKQAFINGVMCVCESGHDFNIVVTTGDTLSLIIDYIMEKKLVDTVTFTAVCVEGVFDVTLDEGFSLVGHPHYGFFSMDVEH